MNSPLVCRCKGVSEQEIRDAIYLHRARLHTDIQRLTGASTGCGRCGRAVVAILENELKIIELKVVKKNDLNNKNDLFQNE